MRTVAYLRVSTAHAYLRVSTAQQDVLDDFIKAPAAGQASEKRRRLDELLTPPPA